MGDSAGGERPRSPGRGVVCAQRSRAKRPRERSLTARCSGRFAIREELADHDEVGESCRSTVRSAVGEKLDRSAGLTANWMKTSSCTIATRMVSMVTCSARASPVLQPEYKVVVLPLPVGGPSQEEP